MKTNLLLAGALLATGIFTANAQTNLATTTITSRGLEAGTLGTGSTFFGYQTGKVNTSTGTSNTFVGQLSGNNNTTGSQNTCLGHSSGRTNIAGNRNTYLGTFAASDLSAGNDNVIIGYSANETYDATANQNVVIGALSYAMGSNNLSLGYNSRATGTNNVVLGHSAGLATSGSNNIILGYQAAMNTNIGNSRLWIENSSAAVPLIWGDFSTDQLKFNGKVGIGLNAANYPTTAASVNVSNYKLIVNGGILSTEVRIAAYANWADYVFEKDYRLKPLSEVEAFIKENGHLPNVPAADEIAAKGFEMGEMAKIQQEKIEELTLYAIQQQKQLDQQQKEIEELKAIVKQLAAKQ